MFVTSVLLKALTCWPTCGNEESGPVAAAVVPGAPGSLWPMIALIGAAAVLVGLLQAVRRKPGTAILSLLSGACLLGLGGAMVRSGRIAGPLSLHLVTPRVPPVARFPRIHLPELPGPGEARVTIAGQEALSEALDELGSGFQRMGTADLVRRLREEDTVLGISELHETAAEARREALENVAEQLRRQLRDAVASHTKLPLAAKLDEHAEDLEEAITELIEGLPESEYIQVVTRGFGAPEAREHRSVVRVNAEQAARELGEKASEFFETKVVPRSWEAARVALSMFALGVLIYLAFVFVDSGTRGHFTWTLRIAVAVAYVGMCGALWYFVP